MITMYNSVTSVCVRVKKNARQFLVTFDFRYDKTNIIGRTERIFMSTAGYTSTDGFIPCQKGLALFVVFVDEGSYS